MKGTRALNSLFRMSVSVVVAIALVLGLLPLVALPSAYADEESAASTAGQSGSDSDTQQANDGEAASSVCDKATLWAAGVDDASAVEDIYPQSQGYNPRARAAAPTVKPMSFSSEMLYFCKYESSCNYDQGLSAGDNYHAMGYFQFDNRYGLGSFLCAVYNYNPKTYAALKTIGDKYNWDVSGATRSNGKFTTLGNDLNTAWHAAYAANPTEFSQLQNGWAYEQYYNASDGVRLALKQMGINIDNRADCVKGLVWGMANLFGKGGGASYIKRGEYYGANWFFKNSGIDDSMSDGELVMTLCDYVIDNVAKRYPNQTQYHKGWQNRYKNELEDCLTYLNYSPKNVWRHTGGYWYWYGSDGKKATGWRTVSGTKYHFDSSGRMQTGWQKISDIWYYFASSGAMKTGWLKTGGKWYYLNSDGSMATGWKKVSGKWYYLKSSGAMATGWLQLSKKWYYLDSSGAMTTGWQTVSGKKYYMNSSGVMQTGWKKLSGKWYYLSSSGAMKTGWLKTGGTWYYLNSNGVMATGWQKVSGKWYYLASSGAMKTGWLKSGGKWYYLNSSGAMVTGTQKIGGKTYRFSSSGAML